MNETLKKPHEISKKLISEFPEIDSYGLIGKSKP